MAKEKKLDQLQTLKAAIRSGAFANLYFFHGEEIFLLHHYFKLLKNSLLDELTESFNFHRFNDENFHIADFLEAVENLPMMAEHTLVVVEDVDLVRFSQEERDKLAQILSDIPQYCTVVFCYLSVPFKADKQLGELYQVIRDGQVVEFAKQEHRDLVAWIQRHFAAEGKRISPDLCVYLIELTDGTMTSLSAEIGKIIAYSGAENICRQDIDAVTEPVLDAVSYRMLDQITKRDSGAALATLHTLLKMQEEPLKILGSIGSHFRRISGARVLLDHGKTVEDLMKLYGIKSEFTAKKAMEAARRTTPEFCAAASLLILQTDRKLKTSYDDPQRLLEMLILQLVLEAGHG